MFAEKIKKKKTLKIPSFEKTKLDKPGKKNKNRT